MMTFVALNKADLELSTTFKKYTNWNASKED